MANTRLGILMRARASCIFGLLLAPFASDALSSASHHPRTPHRRQPSSLQLLPPPRAYSSCTPTATAAFLSSSVICNTAGGDRCSATRCPRFPARTSIRGYGARSVRSGTFSKMHATVHNSGDFSVDAAGVSAMDATLHAIQQIASDSTLSDVQRIQLIRDLMPPPVYPLETEPGMHGETLVAKSFGHLNDLLFLDSCDSHDFQDKTSGGKRKPVKLYRGMPDSNMQLLTSLQRLVGETGDGKRGISPNNARRLEEGMVESFRKYAYESTDLSNDASLWEWLALAQVCLCAMAYSHVCHGAFTYLPRGKSCVA